MSRSPESRLFQAYWEDGVLDLVAGCAVVLIGTGYLFEQMLVPAIVTPLALTAWFILRKQIVEPRAGYVQFASRRRQRSRWEVRGTVAVGLGLFALVLTLALGLRGEISTIRDLVAALPAFLVALAALVAAGLTRSWRFSTYALLLVSSGVATILVGTGPAMPLFLGGAVICGSGTMLLIRFVARSKDFADRDAT